MGERVGLIVGLLQTALVGIPTLAVLGYAASGLGRGGYVGPGELLWLGAGAAALVAGLGGEGADLGTLARLSLLVTLPLWGLLVNASLGVTGPGLTEVMVHAPGVHLVYLAHGLGVAAWIADRRRPAPLPWRQEALILCGLGIGALTGARLALYFSLFPLLAWMVPWAGPPLWAPILSALLFGARLVARLQTGGFERRLALLDAEDEAVLAAFAEGDERPWAPLHAAVHLRGRSPRLAALGLALLWAGASGGLSWLLGEPGLYAGAF